MSIPAYLSCTKSDVGVRHNPYNAVTAVDCCNTNSVTGFRVRDLVARAELLPALPDRAYAGPSVQLLIGQCGYDCTVPQLQGLIAMFSPYTYVLKIEQQFKGPKPTGVFFVTVVKGTELPLMAFHQRLRFLRSGVVSYESNAVENYEEVEVRRILCFKNRRGEKRDHLPVYRMTVEYRRGPTEEKVPFAGPCVEATRYGQMVLRELGIIMG